LIYGLIRKHNGEIEKLEGKEEAAYIGEHKLMGTRLQEFDSIAHISLSLSRLCLSLLTLKVLLGILYYENY